MKHEKPELSRKNPYCLPKYRYLELKNFCFQYTDWKRALARLDGWRAQEGDMGGIVKSNVPSDPTAREGMQKRQGWILASTTTPTPSLRSWLTKSWLHFGRRYGARN